MEHLSLTNGGGKGVFVRFKFASVLLLITILMYDLQFFSKDVAIVLLLITSSLFSFRLYKFFANYQFFIRNNIQL